MGVKIRKFFPTADIGTETVGRLGLMTKLVIDHHIGIVLVTVRAVGKIHHIRGRTTRRAHIDFQSYNLTFGSQIGMILRQTEEFQMDKTASYTEGF